MMLFYSLFLRSLQSVVAYKRSRLNKAESQWELAVDQVEKAEAELNKVKSPKPIDFLKVGKMQEQVLNTEHRISQLSESYQKWVNFADRLGNLKGRHVPSLVGWISCTAVWLWVAQNRPEWIPSILATLHTVPTFLNLVGV